MKQQQWGAEEARRTALPKAYGEYIARLAVWSWFVTVTFRDAPNRDAAVKGIESWLADMQADASPFRLGWILAEEFGRAGGRFHCHLLVSGVDHLRRDFWWHEAFRRFGRSEIRPFDPSQYAAYYVAKYAAKALGAIHLGGTLAGISLHKPTRSQDGRRTWIDSQARSSAPMATHSVVSPSASLPRDFFRLNLGRWHR